MAGSRCHCPSPLAESKQTDIPEHNKVGFLDPLVNSLFFELKINSFLDCAVGYQTGTEQVSL